jgi:hypothetical protein
MVFENFNVKPPSGETASFVCINVIDEQGLPGNILVVVFLWTRTDVQSFRFLQFNGAVNSLSLVTTCNLMCLI